MEIEIEHFIVIVCVDIQIETENNKTRGYFPSFSNNLQVGAASSKMKSQILTINGKSTIIT
jgi:hypothetical protein